MMTDEDIQEYHNIGKAIKHNDKYTYITGTQITDQETGTRDQDQGPGGILEGDLQEYLGNFEGG